MLDGIDQRREMFVLVGAAAADPRRRIEEEIKLPEIADALGQAAMAVGVGVDRPGMIRRRLASMTSALAFLTAPGATMSAMTSSSTTMSRGSPRAVETKCTNPPVITSMETILWRVELQDLTARGQRGRCQLARSYGG
jgi:hypothetical protein